MAAVNSPNMSLPIPSVGTTPGPDYAANVNASLTLIDQHDHSPGRGVQVTPAGLNINVTLDMQSNDLDNINSLIFNAQASSSVLQALYVAPGTESPAINDLYFNDGSGNVIQLTSAGAVNAIIGSLPGESFAGGTFFWKQGTGSTTPANFDIGSIVLRPNVAATTLGVTLSPPGAIASAYSVALPILPIGGTKIMSMGTGGDMFALIDVDNASIQLVANVLAVKALGIQTSMINAGAVTEPKMADDSVSTRTIIDSAVTRVKLNDDVRLTLEQFDRVTASFTVRAATTVNGTLSTAFDNGSVIDGITLVTSDLILIKNQTNTPDNGVYVVQASGNPVRSTSYDTFSELNYAAVTVTLGTINASSSWFQNNLLTSILDAQSWSISSTVAWVVPTDVTVVNVTMVGGGGGGAGEQTSGLAFNGYGAGGGAGSLSQSASLVVVPGETLNIQVAGGGRAGGQNAATAPTAGGTSAIRRTNTSIMSVIGSTAGNTNGSGIVGAAVSTSINITGTIVGSGAGGAGMTGNSGTAGQNNFYAVGGAAGTAGTGGGQAGGGGGGGGAGLEAGGAGGIGANNSSGATGGAGGVGGIGAGGGGGAGSSAGLGGAGGAGGNGQIVISYF